VSHVNTINIKYNKNANEYTVANGHIFSLLNDFCNAWPVSWALNTFLLFQNGVFNWYAEILWQ